MSIVGYAVGSGLKTALTSIAGTAVGNVVAMSFSLAGIGVLLAASALAFTILKWLGALYLIGLGIIAIARSGTARNGATTSTPISPRTAFMSNVVIGTLNPKTIAFFVAFAPQFIDAQGNYALQAAILVITFGLVVGCTDIAYALAAVRASNLFKMPTTMLWSKRAGGGVLIAAGVVTAATRR
jgi:threonine/homoserine/homoserine lactone efflux protein